MTTFLNLIMYIIILCSKLSMTSTSCLVLIQPLSHLIGHLRVISQKYLIIPVNSSHLTLGLSKFVFGVPETLGFISDILRSEEKVELLHCDSMFCQYLSLSRTQLMLWVHLLSMRYSAMDLILQSGMSNTKGLGQSSDWHFCVDSVAIHGCKELLIIAESHLRGLRLGVVMCVLWGAKWTKSQMARPQKTVLARNVGLMASATNDRCRRYDKWNKGEEGDW